MYPPIHPLSVVLQFPQPCLKNKKEELARSFSAQLSEADMAGVVYHEIESSWYLSHKLYPTWLLIDDEIEFYLVWKYLQDARYVIKSVIYTMQSFAPFSNLKFFV